MKQLTAKFLRNQSHSSGSLAKMASLALLNDLVSFQEREGEISPAINMRKFSKLVPNRCKALYIPR